MSGKLTLSSSVSSSNQGLHLHERESFACSTFALYVGTASEKILLKSRTALSSIDSAPRRYVSCIGVGGSYDEPNERRTESGLAAALTGLHLIDASREK
jgi:hypothetical protein